MKELDIGALTTRLTSSAKSSTQPNAEFPEITRMPYGNETLAWLAGNRMAERSKTLNPPAGANDPHADELLQEKIPVDPIQAAARRASVLADLHSNAPRDPRVISVFENDPIVAEDPGNGNLVTRQMLSCRLDVFDTVLTLLGRPTLSRGTRARTSLALKGAFAMLDDDAQVEWALSEVRFEETKAFLNQCASTDLNALVSHLNATLEKHDIWTAARAFSMAAHLSVGASKGSATLADLLEMRDVDK